MTDNNGIRSGSLQFYPRVRAKKIIPQVNWKHITSEKTNFLGFIGYKVAMISVWAKDETPDSMTKGKRIAIPSTIVECPTMKIYAVRFYKNKKVLKDIVLSNDKSLKKKIKRSKKEISKEIILPQGATDVRVILFSNVKDTAVDKKKPDMLEVAVSGSLEEKMDFIKEQKGKEIHITDIFSDELLDVRAVTKGFGTQGPVKRFGIALKDHKSEKGRRRPGSLAPWHPARVTFRAPQAGQTGFHNRISYNAKIMEVGSIKDKNINKKSGFKGYGVVKNDYLILAGSIPGPRKRGVVLSKAMKPSRIQSKRKYEVLELR